MPSPNVEETLALLQSPKKARPLQDPSGPVNSSSSIIQGHLLKVWQLLCLGSKKPLNNQKIALDKIHGSTPKNDGFSKF